MRIAFEECRVRLTALTGVILLAVAPGAAAQQCKPKTAGYFTQMAAFNKNAPSPIQMAGMARPVIEAIGNPARGKGLVADTKGGDCLACHKAPGQARAQGDLGPNLAGVGNRYTEAQLRQIVVDPHVLFPASLMPAYFKVQDAERVPPDLAGKTVLGGQEVEDVVAYLKSLR